ncbi:PIN domain-containing protein [soil metagenome]
MSVLDASAVLAFLRDEPGADAVEAAISTGVIAAPNWSEVVQKLRRASVSADLLTVRLLATGVEVEPLFRVDAELAAEIWDLHPSLSLADRSCLAVAARLELPVLTADAAWFGVDIGVDVVVIR